MTQHLLAESATESDSAEPASLAALAQAGMAGPVLRLQRTAGNAAVTAWAQRPPAGRARAIARCGAGGCTCGGKCGGHTVTDEEQRRDLAAALALRQALTRRSLARQVGGGPYHPPVGTPMACTEADSCSAISTKINYLRHTIRKHQEWDAANPDPRWPGGRHAGEIADLQRALANCTAIASRRCRGQPQWIPVPDPVPVEDPEERAERVKRQLFEALPYALAIVVVGLVIACVIAEPCGAAVAAALAAVLGEEALAVVIGILATNGVRMAW